MKLRALLTVLTLAMAGSPSVWAADEVPTPAISGYDPVAYQTEGRAERGSGYFVSTYRGQTYLFASEARKQAFDAEPARFVPAYNGWCAYGVSVGKKFHADPTVFAVVDGRTYLNLDASIQKKWNEARAKSIRDADGHWKKIAGRAAAKL
jgi:YHS domain-containing protein